VIVNGKCKKEEEIRLGFEAWNFKRADVRTSFEEVPRTEKNVLSYCERLFKRDCVLFRAGTAFLRRGEREQQQRQ